jgi:CRISPR-associated protein Csd1
MILQALVDYYQRRAVDPDAGIAPFGFSLEKIGFVLVVDEHGALVQVEDIRDSKGSKKIPVQRLLPQAVKRASGIAANLLLDKAEYVLGVDAKGKADRAAKQHQAFVARITDELLPQCNDVGLQAVAMWLAQPSTVLLDQVAHHLDLQELKAPGTNLSFKLVGDPIPLVCQRPEVVTAINRLNGQHDAANICLVTGKADTVARLHPAIKGVWGAQSSGANIVSFNLSAFTSYHKEQGENAPIGEQAAFAYTTALNVLLHKRSLDSGPIQCLQVGDASTVFWADKPNHPLEASFASLFAEPPRDNPAQGTEAVRALYEAVRKGGYTPDDRTTRFFVLGLAPNASRISIRFWHVLSVAQLAPQIQQHFEDIAIVRPNYNSGVPSLFRLLTSIAPQGKADNIPPNLAGDTMRAILNGLPYPYTLLQAAIHRNRAEQSVTPNRAALIKASLNRLWRTIQKETLSVALDTTRTDVGYRLGRLFAVLEKLQNEAQGDINRTISESYFGAASSTPRSVFRTLMRLHQHHLRKLEADRPGRDVYFRKLIGEVVNGLDDYPPQLNLEAQGLFSIGYYHQQQAFYVKSDASTQGE